VAEKNKMSLNKVEQSLGGFTDEAGDFCLRHGIGVADQIEEL
jgi:hypothetical protein